MSAVASVEIRRLDLPLHQPYRLSYRTFHTFEPFVVRVIDAQGRAAFADGHVSPGSSEETREGAWAHLNRWAEQAIGRDAPEARAAIEGEFAQSKVAATAICTALELLESDGPVSIPGEVRLPLLAPVNATDPAEIEREIAVGVAAGFPTFKVKVGKDVEADLARLAAIQAAAKGRATLRLDANRAFSEEDAIRFARGLDAEGLELFEQPCAAEDWDANAAVAAASPVPLMLDEPICTLADIERAGAIEGVGFCKLKLKRFGGMARLREGLQAVRAHGMEPVLGDGLGSEIQSWLEACAAADTIRNAGEFNGFRKTKDRLLTPHLPFDRGAIVLPAGYAPALDMAALDDATKEIVTHA